MFGSCSCTRHAAVLIAATLLTTVLALTACSVPGQPAISLRPDAASLSAACDWDDLEAAVDVAAERSEFALVHAECPDPDTRRFILRSIRDEPVVLVVRRAPPEPGARGDSIAEMHCTVGRFGDPQRERRFLRDLRRRLDQLAGFDHAPLPFFW